MAITLSRWAPVRLPSKRSPVTSKTKAGLQPVPGPKGGAEDADLRKLRGAESW